MNRHSLSTLFNSYAPIGLFALLLFAGLSAHAELADVDALLDAGEVNAAEAMLNESAEGASKHEIDLRRGRIDLARNDFEAAYEKIAPAAKALANQAAAQFWLGAAAGNLAANASVFKAGRYAKISRQAFERAIELDPQYSNAYTGLINFHLQAPRIVGGSKKEAAALADRLAKIDALEGGLAKARVQRATGDDDEALSTLEAMTKAIPGDPRAWLELGFSAQRDDDYPAAHAAFSSAAAIDADSEETRRAVLSAQYQVGRTAVFSESNVDAGIAALSDYVTTETMAGLPGIDWAHYRLGQLHEMAGDMASAKAAFEQADALTEDDQLRDLVAAKR